MGLENHRLLIIKDRIRQTILTRYCKVFARHYLEYSIKVRLRIFLINFVLANADVC